jgi:ATP-binding cassette subfamily F protein 3
LTAGAKAEAPKKNSEPKPTVDRKEQKRIEAEQRQAKSNKLKGHRQLVHDLEKKIQALEKRQTEITAELEKSETYQSGGKATELNREFHHNAEELAAITPKWEEAASKLSALDTV